MADETTATDASTAPVEGETQSDSVDEPLGEAGQKALKAEREARKALEAQLRQVQASLKEKEQEGLSDLEKAQKAADDARKQLEQLQREATVAKVALEKGVPADLVGFLTGDDADAISAQADILMARLSEPRTPKPDPSQGGQSAKGGKTNGDLFTDFFNQNLNV